MLDEFFGSELEKIRAAGLHRRFTPIDGPQGPVVNIAGREIVNFCSNDYLGLAADARLKDAAVTAMERYGFGSGASRLVSGTISPHVELERKSADFVGKPSAVLFGSGYAANAGTISAIAGRGDALFLDRANHASIVDGAILSRADMHRYAHRDMKSLEKLLGSVRPGRGKKRLIITEGVFSMDGDIAPLADIVELAGKYSAGIILDDAHGIGVLGKTGRGTAELFGVTGRIDVIVGTYGKSVGGAGAFVAGSEQMADFVLNRARSYIYSTAIPASTAAANAAGLEIIDKEKERISKLHRNILYLNEKLFGILKYKLESPIGYILIGSNDGVMVCSEKLLSAGVFVQGIRSPTVPKGTERLRITVTAAHDSGHIDRLAGAIGKIKGLAE